MRVPGLPPVKLLDQTSSAIVNFSRFDDANAALAAATDQTLILGKDRLVYAVLLPQFNTCLILRMIQRFRQAGSALVIGAADAADLAHEVAADCGVAPVSWSDAVARCPHIFRIDPHSESIHLNPNYGAADAPVVFPSLSLCRPRGVGPVSAGHDRLCCGFGYAEPLCR